MVNCVSDTSKTVLVPKQTDDATDTDIVLAFFENELSYPVADGVGAHF